MFNIFKGGKKSVADMPAPLAAPALDALQFADFVDIDEGKA